VARLRPSSTQRGIKVRVSSGGAAEGGSVPRPRLVQLTLARAQEDARHLGEQIRPAARDLAQRRDGGGGGLLVGRLPPGVTLRLARQLGDDHPVGRWSFAHTF
jgi:hypothetical protein